MIKEAALKIEKKLNIDLKVDMNENLQQAFCCKGYPFSEE